MIAIVCVPWSIQCVALLITRCFQDIAFGGRYWRKAESRHLLILLCRVEWDFFGILLITKINPQIEMAVLGCGLKILLGWWSGGMMRLFDSDAGALFPWLGLM